MKTKTQIVLILLLTLILTACSGKTASTQAVPGILPQPDVQLITNTSQAQKFVDLLVKGEFDQAEQYFDAKMKEEMPAAKLKETWDYVIKQVGPYQQVTETRSEPFKQSEQTYEIVHVITQFEKSPLGIRVVFDQAEKIAGLYFSAATPIAKYEAPVYAKPESFEEKDVTVGTGQWALPGTLTLPKGEGPFPAVALVHGSGPGDRDETVGANKPFKDLAWGLASQGVAVLRYEKRTREHADEFGPIMNTMTMKEETIDDALAAASLLRQTPGIDPQRVFVLGYSLGGMLAPRIAAADPQLAGLIVMAGATRPLEDIILEQVTYLSNLDGKLSADEQKQIDDLKKLAERVKDPGLSTATPASDLFNIPASYWLDLRGYNPPEAAQNLSQPMLILQGERDYQVSTVDFENWKKALSSKKNAVFKLYPGLNHLFITGQGPSNPDEYNQPGHVDQAVVEDIAAFIQQH